MWTSRGDVHAATVGAAIVVSTVAVENSGMEKTVFMKILEQNVVKIICHSLKPPGGTLEQWSLSCCLVKLGPVDFHLFTL